MKKKARIEEEVEKTLQCFETTEKVEPNPFFYTRLQAKIRSIEEKKESSKKSGLSLALRPALLLCLVVINLLSAVLVFRESDSQADIREYYLTTFAEEYALKQDEQNEYDLFLSNN